MIIGISLIVLLKIIVFTVRFYKYYRGVHHCHECEQSFFLRYGEHEYVHCPYCGKKLTYFYVDNTLLDALTDECQKIKEN